MLILDSDILIEVERKNARIIESIMRLREDHPEDMCITSAVYAEFCFGLMPFSEAKREHALRMLDFYRVLDFDKAAAKSFSYIKWVLEKRGKMIPIFDIINATIALKHGATLLTADAHYEQVPGLNFIKIEI